MYQVFFRKIPYPIFESIRAKCPSVKDIVIYRSEAEIPGTHFWDQILADSSPEVDPVDIDPLDTATSCGDCRRL